MQLSLPKTPSRVPKTARIHSHSFKTLTPKHTRRFSNTQTKHEYSIADLFIRKARHLPPEQPVVDVEKGFAAGAYENTEVDGEGGRAGWCILRLECLLHWGWGCEFGYCYGGC
jgi:hypothetical protein